MLTAEQYRDLWLMAANSQSYWFKAYEEVRNEKLVLIKAHEEYENQAVICLEKRAQFFESKYRNLLDKLYDVVAAENDEVCP